jgi:hypothetical protein
MAKSTTHGESSLREDTLLSMFRARLTWLETPCLLLSAAPAVSPTCRNVYSNARAETPVAHLAHTIWLVALRIVNPVLLSELILATQAVAVRDLIMVAMLLSLSLDYFLYDIHFFSLCLVSLMDAGSLVRLDGKVWGIFYVSKVRHNSVCIHFWSHACALSKEHYSLVPASKFYGRSRLTGLTITAVHSFNPRSTLTACTCEVVILVSTFLHI